MSPRQSKRKALKERVYQLLQLEDPSDTLKGLLCLQVKGVVNTLFPFLCDLDPATRWRAVWALGKMVSELAQHDMESARVIIRRLMWSLNEDSGAVGWGAPEAMGEILACHQGLANEFLPMLISYLRDGTNYLDNPQLRRGAVWAVARLCWSYPDTLRVAGIKEDLVSVLRHEDPYLKAMAVWGLNGLGEMDIRGLAKSANDEDSTVSFMLKDGSIKKARLGQIIKEASKPNGGGRSG